jgi:hypothetical protein
LLGITTDWWDRDDTISVRYEDLVRDPSAELRRLAEDLGPTRCDSIDAVVAANTLGALRKTSVNNHYWKGRPGLWRSLIPPEEAEELRAALAPTLDRLGYSIDPDRSLTARQADRNWVDLVGPELSELSRKTAEGLRSLWSWTDENTRHLNAELERTRSEHDQARGDLAQARAERDEARTQARHLADALAHEEHRAHLIQAAHEHTTHRLDEAHRELAPFRRLGRLSIRTAEMVQSARDRVPMLARLAHKLLRRS